MLVIIGIILAVLGVFWFAVNATERRGAFSAFLGVVVFLVGVALLWYSVYAG